MRLNRTYAIITLLLFTIEALIAIFLKSGFIRHTFGDYLVVILIYCSFKSFIEIHTIKLAISVLLFAYIIEFLQLSNMYKILDIQNNQIAKIILGSTFQISDLVAYTFGILTVLIIELNIYKI